MHSRTWRARAWQALALDAVWVLVFVVIGRASHARGESVAGIASTAWPFLAGLGAGWLAILLLARSPFAVMPSGVVAWLATVAAGMMLRVVSGQGTDVAFTVVALAFLGLFLLGWRVLLRGAPLFTLRELSCPLYPGYLPVMQFMVSSSRSRPCAM
jgi:hypothetical protein